LQEESSAHATPEKAASAEVEYGKLPLSFEANQGQTDPQVRFTARGAGYSLFLTDSAAVLTLARPATQAQSTYTSDAIRMELVRSRRNASIAGTEQLPGTVNYFAGSDSSRWHTGVPTYARVRYSDVYDGIDLVYYGNQSRLEYDFVVKPKADPRAIRLHFTGADRLILTPAGDLALKGIHGPVFFYKPIVYQVRDGRRVPIPGNFTLLSSRDAGFTLGSYDHSSDLIIDPALNYTTYLGGNIYTTVNALAIDGVGDAFVAGYTGGLDDFPVTTGAFQTTPPGAFISKLNPEGTALIYSTYLGGSQSATVNGIAVDSKGDAFVTGTTFSYDFPITPGAFQAHKRANNGTVFITELNPAGSALLYSTYLGGSSYDFGNAIAIDKSGDAYIAGFTYSSDFPTTPGAFQKSDPGGPNSFASSFVAEMNPTGTALMYSTYLGGSGSDQALALALNQSGNAYVVGAAGSTDFPVTPGAYETTNIAGTSGFITELESDGSGLVYSSYLNLGPAGAVALDGDLDAYVAGTAATNAPASPGAFQLFNLQGNSNIYIAKLNPSGSALGYSTYLGGSYPAYWPGFGGFSDDFYPQPVAIAVDSDGDAYVAGTSNTPDFPTTHGARQGSNQALIGYEDSTLQTEPVYGDNAFITELNPRGTALIYSTYLGGSLTRGSEGGDGADYATSIALDASGHIVVAGSANSSNFPVTPGAFQTTNKTVSNPNTVQQTGFVSRFEPKRVAGERHVEMPTFSPGQGSYATPQSIALTDSTPDASIYYTLDGSTPNKYSTLYVSGAPIPFSQSTTNTINAIAVADGYFDSLVASATFVIDPASASVPTFAPPPGKYLGSASVTLSDTTPNAVIHYTLDGSTPLASSPIYTTALALASTTTVKAIATANGYWKSSVVAAQYSIIPQAPTPVISPSGGSYPASQLVTITDADATATIRYTTDGSTPTPTSLYYSKPFPLAGATTIHAIAIATDEAASEVATASF
jgi:hypothetical protein